MIETIFFIIIILFLIFGLFYNQLKNKKENLTFIEKEKAFREDQKNYYAGKNKTIYEKNCSITNFVQLDNARKNLKPNGICETFSNIKEGNTNYNDSLGRIDSENTAASFVYKNSGETKYDEMVQRNCDQFNQGLKNLNFNDATGVNDFFNQINTVNTDLINGEGCGYCYNEDDGNSIGEILYGDENGPIPVSGIPPSCKTWVSPGSALQGGGYPFKHNKWKRGGYNAENTDYPNNKFPEFGGNIGIKDDIIKLHEQKICSEVKDCGDLDGKRNICGWCYMGRKGDGIGEGMVIDPNNNGETKYMDDYCPWPGETTIDEEGNIIKRINPYTSGENEWEWNGYSDGTNTGNQMTAQLADDLINRDAQQAFENEKANFEKKKKYWNDILLLAETQNEKEEAINNINEFTNKIKAIRRIINSGNDAYKNWKTAEDTIDDEDGLKIYNKGRSGNNNFLYKFNNKTISPTSDFSRDIFFVKSYYELTPEQKGVLKALDDTHKFYKNKCQTNMTILDKEVTQSQINKCLEFNSLLNKPKNQRLKNVFMNIDLSKEKVGCEESSNKGSDSCSAVSYSELKSIFKTNEEVDNNNSLGNKLSRAFRSRLFDISNSAIDNEGEEPKLTSLEDSIENWVVEQTKNGEYDSLELSDWGIGMKKYWRLLINYFKDVNPREFEEPMKLSTNILNDSVGNEHLNSSAKVAAIRNNETPELKKWRTGDRVGTRLMTTPGQCKALDDDNPCFRNWLGTRDISGNFQGNANYDKSKPMGHNDACYDQLWLSETELERAGITGNEQPEYNDKISGTGKKSCSAYSNSWEKNGLTENQKFKGQMSKSYTLDDGSKDSLMSLTINSYDWKSSAIEDIKVKMQEMRKTADIGDTYSAYDKDSMLNSSKIMAEACYDLSGNGPDLVDDTDDTGLTMPFECADRFISSDKTDNFRRRPSGCTNYFWKKHSGTKQLNHKYDEKDRNTWGNVWGMKNVVNNLFADKIHHKEEFSNKNLNDELKKMVDYIDDFKIGIPAKPTPANFDEYLYYKRIVYETLDDNDIIWKNLDPAYRMNVGDDKPWVKMCWGDFKDAIIDLHHNKDCLDSSCQGENGYIESQSKDCICRSETGSLKLHIDISLNDIITGRDNKINKSILDSVINYDDINSPEITEEMYNKKWFPFWRYFSAKYNKEDGNILKYYETDEYNINEVEQTRIRNLLNNDWTFDYKAYKLSNHSVDWADNITVTDLRKVDKSYRPPTDNQ